MGNNRKTVTASQARFIELGSMGAPFRSLLNVDHISNVRFEQKVGQSEAEYDDAGQMTAPPQQFLEGWVVIVVIGHGAGGQNIMFNEEAQAISCYNSILDMIAGVGAPMARMPKLRPEPVPSAIVGADGAPMDADNDPLPGEALELTEEEIDQIANPEIDVDSIADAIDEGLSDEKH